MTARMPVAPDVVSGRHNSDLRMLAGLLAVGRGAGMATAPTKDEVA